MQQINPAYLIQLKRRSDIKWRLVLANNLTLKYGTRAVNTWIKNNNPNGPLTKIENLQILSSGLSVPIKSLLIQSTHETNHKGKHDPEPVSTGQIG